MVHFEQWVIENRSHTQNNGVERLSLCALISKEVLWAFEAKIHKRNYDENNQILIDVVGKAKLSSKLTPYHFSLNFLKGCSDRKHLSA